MRVHPDVAAAHAEFGGDLADMQRQYDLSCEAEKLADAILTAAGSGLRHYTLPKTRAAILQAAESALQQRAEECALIADEHGRSLDNEWNRSLGGARDLIETCEEVAQAIRTRYGEKA